MEKVSSETLLIALTFDAEMDAFDPSIISGDKYTWHGIERGIPLIDEILVKRFDSFGQGVRATWFVRCDDQIQAFYGSHAFLLKNYENCWRQHHDAGDEIAFHPHLYRQIGEEWRQETDHERLRVQLMKAYEAMRGANFESNVSRIGEAYGSNTVMASLQEIGIKCDSSAMPGRVRVDGVRNINWDTTPTQPYNPSYANYREPGVPCYSLIEAPMSMVSTKTRYDQQPIRRYVDLSFHHDILRQGLSNLVAVAPVIITVTHPSSILSDLSARAHGLLSFNISTFAENLDFIIDECLRLGRPFRFVTLREFVRG